MTFVEFKHKQNELYATLDAASKALQVFPRGATGLTPDEVKLSPEYQKASMAYKKAYTYCRAFNGVWLKVFKKEEASYRRDRLSRRLA